MVSGVRVDHGQWLRVLARWALIAALFYLILFVLFFFEVPLMQNSGLPEVYNDLLMATRSAVLARVSTLLSMAYWISIGGFFIVSGVSFSSERLVRGALLMAIGIGQLPGVLGNVLQINAVGDLAARYAAATADQQAALLRSFADLRLVYTSGFELSGLLWSIGLLLLASAAWSGGIFPRWLTILTGAAGAIALVNFGVILVSGKYDAPVVAELMLMVVFFAVAIGLWRAKAGRQVV